jgi:hypothetical protein
MSSVLNHSAYFEQQVQSVGFTRNGRKQTVGAIAPGSFHFGTQAPERMTIISGECRVRRDGTGTWTVYAAGSAFEVAANSGFDIACDAPCAYWCEFLA